MGKAIYEFSEILLTHKIPNSMDTESILNNPKVLLKKKVVLQSQLA